MKPVPKIDMNDNETGCCPRFHPEEWDEEILEFDSLLFAKAHSRNFMHIPVNLGKVMAQSMEKIDASDAKVMDTYLTLTHDLSPWKAEHLYLVEQDVQGMEMVRLSGRFASKVFEGEYKQQPKWMAEMESYVKGLGETGKKMYAFYTTCPECAKHYGKNFVVMLMELAEDESNA